LPKVVAQQAIKTLAKFFICMKYIALVSYDDNGNFFVETPTIKLINEDMVTHKVDYNVFIKLLEEAKNSLK